jgi:hypothetical protein
MTEQLSCHLEERFRENLLSIKAKVRLKMTT